MKLVRKVNVSTLYNTHPLVLISFDSFNASASCCFPFSSFENLKKKKIDGANATVAVFIPKMVVYYTHRSLFPFQKGCTGISSTIFQVPNWKTNLYALPKLCLTSHPTRALLLIWYYISYTVNRNGKCIKRITYLENLRILSLTFFLFFFFFFFF